MKIKQIKGKLKKIRPVIWLTLVLIFAAALRLIFFIGFNWSDAPSYAFEAYRVTTSNFRQATYLPALRILNYFPAALFYVIFGVSDFSAGLWSMLCSLGLIIVVFKTGRLLFDKSVGLISAFLLSFYPLDIIYSTQLMPDVPIAFFTALSVYIFLLAEKMRKNSNKFYYFISGIVCGLAYLVRENGIIVILFFVVYILFLKRKIKLQYFLIIGGILLIFLIEGIYHYWQNGDFLLRYHVVSTHYAKPTKEQLMYEFNLDFTYFPRVMFNLDNRFHFMSWNNRLLYGFYFYAFLVAVTYLLIKKEERSILPIVWLLTFFLYLEFGPMRVWPYLTVHKLDRHLTVLEAPLMLTIGFFISKIWKSNVGKIFSIGLFLFLLWTSLDHTNNIVNDFRRGTADFDPMYDFLKNLPQKTIYADQGTITHLNFHFEYKRLDSLKDLQWVKDCSEIKDSYVIVDGQRPWIENPDLSSKLPECIHEPPKNWELLTTIKSVDRGGISEGRDPKIYYVP